MGNLCGLAAPFSWAQFYSKIGGIFKKKTKADPVELVIGHPYNATHELHICKDDVDCAMAATGGNVACMDDITKWRSEATFFNVKTQDGELAGNSVDKFPGKDVDEM